MVPPSGKVWVTSKLQVTRSPCTLPLDLAVVSLWVGSPGRVNWKVMSKACRTNTAVLPTTWPGVKSPLPLTVNWTVCPSQAAGNVRLWLGLLGSAAAPWARAAIIRIPKVRATQRRRSMQAPLKDAVGCRAWCRTGPVCLLPARADSEVQRSKAITPSPSQAAVPEPICLLARGESFNRRNSLVLLIRGFCLFRANEWTSPGAGAAGGMIGDRVVVSEVQAVALPADRRADLGRCCPWLSAADRRTRMVRGPRAAQAAVEKLRLALTALALGLPLEA